MRGSDLLGLPVVGPDGAEFGRVLDVRLVQDGPLLGAFAALRVDGLVVGRHRLAARLGYDRHDAHGPVLVRVLARWWARGNGYVTWDRVRLADGRVHVPDAELPAVPAL